MSVTERTHFPAIRTVSCTGGSGDGVDVEDLLYRAKRKPNQKTYRNRHINTIEQEPRNQEALQYLDVEGKNAKLVSVKKKAAPKKQVPKRAPRGTLTLVKDIGIAPGPQEVCSPSFCIVKHDTDHLVQLQEYSDTAIDSIETQISRRFQKKSRPNETRRRYSLSQLRRTVKVPIRETIDLKEFKFPQTPQTPRSRRYLNWTPGSGFDNIQPPSPTALSKRFGRRSHVDSSRRSRIRCGDQPKTKAVGDESSNAHRRNGEVLKRRLFASSHDTEISTCDSVGESGKPAEEAAEDEQWQPLCKIGQQEVQEGEGPALAEELQNHQEASIGQTLAEGSSRRKSLRECCNKTAKASFRDAEPSHTVLDVHSGNATDSQTANRTRVIAIEPEPNVSAIFPYSAYLHPPSSALQDPPIHNTREAIPTSTRSGIAFFPYRAYLHPPSSTLQEAAMLGAKQIDKEVEIADQDTDKETGSRQGSSSLGSTSDEEDWETMHEENEELKIAEQNAAAETESSGSSTSDEEDWETMLETDDDHMNSRRPTPGEPDDEDMLDGLEQQHPAQ